MKNSILLFLLAAVVFTAGTSCNRRGCTHPAAVNYNPDANREDGTCIFPNDIEPVRQGVLYIYFQGVDRPTELTVNGRSVLSQLIDAGTGTVPDFCNNDNYSAYMIVLNLFEAQTIVARNSTYEWSIKDIVLTDGNGKGECRAVGLTKDNAKEINVPQGKTLVTFSTGMETGMRDIIVKLDGDSVGTLKERESGAGISIELTAGKHGYTAKSQNGHVWADSFIVVEGKTSTITFSKANATMPANMSNLIFYSTVAKNVSVFLDNNYVGKTSAASTPGAGVACTAVNAVSYLSEGGKSYNYTATSPDGQIWTGRVDANTGSGCILVELN